MLFNIVTLSPEGNFLFDSRGWEGMTDDTFEANLGKQKNRKKLIYLATRVM